MVSQVIIFDNSQKAEISLQNNGLMTLDIRNLY